MKEAPIIVSACLAGMYCRYNGDTQPHETIIELVSQGQAIPFCPEVHGGLSTPRAPCEIQENKVVDSDGIDRTEAFQRGAEEGLRLARLVGSHEAILKARSPSCGSSEIYDGTFSSTRIAGDGLFARLLKDNGFSIRTEEDLPE
ncbi:hypothetical protein SYK_25820 [Pseudodesulfovibrio nedwellii]|uniref:DUF523 domain-containing protein n=1 Tax=Pseudodesulfovibrio nedwellii TaxID=2973072 RepID=A0ABM8B3L5_9BACT|nr:MULTISPECIES: DUF523 domain-containing protein [Pseudodesulfovibrio]BDQ38222.1 hypothetical protein SYK_25820 [Pseudodesulfovibrio nedwellii]